METLKPSHELFLKAYRHNWDNGTAALKRILKNKNCDRATAQLVYWLGCPEFYNKFTEDEIPSHASEVLKLLQFIEGRFGDYPSKIAFDPSTDLEITVPKNLGRIPADLAAPTIGPVKATDLAYGRHGQQMLLRAASDGDVQVLREAIAGGLDVDKKVGREYLLDRASMSGQAEVIELLAEHGVNLKRKTGPSGLTALHRVSSKYSSQSKRWRAIETILAHGVSIDIRAKWRRTALHYAVWADPHFIRTKDSERKMKARIEFLLEKGADPLAKDAERKTPVDMAKETGNKVAFALLTKALGDN